MEDPHRIPGKGERRHFEPPWPEEAGRRPRGSWEPAADLRAMGRLAVGFAWLAALLPAYWALRAASGPSARRRLERAFRARLARDILRIMGIEFRAVGPRPPAPVLLASNHVSWLDDLVILALCSPAPVTLERAFPGYSTLARSIGCVVIARSSLSGLPAVVAGVERALRRGERATFHPEATTGFGGELKPFHTALFQAAVARRSPVACACIAYRVPAPAPSPERSIHWVDWTSFPVHMWRVLGLRGIKARLCFAPLLPPPADRKSASAMARAEIGRLAAEYPPAPRAPGRPEQGDALLAAPMVAAGR